MSKEPNKPIEAEELTEKELEGVVGGATRPKMEKEYRTAFISTADDQSIVCRVFGHISEGA